MCAGLYAGRRQVVAVSSFVGCVEVASLSSLS